MPNPVSLEPITRGIITTGFSRYQLTGELGRGGVGAVLAATDRTLRRDVAIKVLHEGADSDRARVAFMEEAQITGQLQHPGVVPVHELGLDDEGRPYLAMKRVSGHTFREAIRRAWSRAGDDGADAARRRLLEVFLKVCEAIAYAHNRRVIHRDLKPDNVMVGAFGEVHVMDWGLARPINAQTDDAVDGDPEDDSDAGSDILNSRVMTDRREAGQALTMVGTVVGTPEYMAPEQATGGQQLDEGVDIHALGGILYTLLTDQLPFTGRNQNEVLAAVLEHQLEPPSSRAPDKLVPRELDAVVMKAMARRRRERYRSVLDLMSDIRRYLSGHTLTAADYSSWQLFSKWVQRNKALVFSGAAIVLIALAGLIGVIVAINRGQVEALQAEAAAQQREQQKQRDDAAEQASALHAEAASALDCLVDTFNPAAPQAWFSARLPLVLKMGRALQTHPDPPAEWRTNLAEVTATMQANAEAIGDQAMAQHLADSAEFWRAIDAEEHARRLQQLQATVTNQQQADRLRLEQVLALIGNAEGKLPDDGGLAPGELDERSRALASYPGTTITAELIDRLAVSLDDEEKAAVTGEKQDTGPGYNLPRQFMVDALGRRGDALTSGPQSEQTAVQLVARQVSRLIDDWPRIEEWRYWVWAAVRLESANPGVFRKVGVDLVETTRRVAAQFDKRPDVVLLTRKMADDSPGGEGDGIATAVAEEALQLLAIVRHPDGSQPLPAPSPTGGQRDPFTDSDQFVRIVDQLGDWVAGTSHSGAYYTSLLLDKIAVMREAGQRLSARQAAFVVDQLGLIGDELPPDVARPRRAATPVLLSLLAAASDADLLDTHMVAEPTGSTAEQQERLRRRACATAATRSLARMPSVPRGTTHRVFQRRAASGESLFRERTQTAFRLLPDNDWPKPEHADEHIERGRAWLDKGNPDDAVRSAEAALILSPQDAGALHLLGDAAFIRGRYSEALNHYAAAIGALHSGSPVSLRVTLLVSHGNCLVALGNAHESLLDFATALQHDDQSAAAWMARTNALCTLGQLEEAISDADNAAALMPYRPEPFIIRGLARGFIARDYRRDETIRQQLIDQTMADFDRALRLSPNMPLAYLGRGIMRIVLQREQVGLADVLEALRLDPSTARLTSAIGHFQLAGADEADMITRLPGAIARINEDPTDWISPLLVGSAFRRAKQEPLALMYFGIAVERTPWRFRLICQLMRLYYWKTRVR